MTPIAVTTQAFGNGRNRCNTQETVLSVASVKARGIARLRSVAMLGDKRGAEAQPLLCPGLLMADLQVHDVMITASMGGYVQATDYVTGEPLWSQRVCLPVPGTLAMDMWGINDHWGPLSTPVVDPETGLIYLCTMNSTDGTYAECYYELLTLDLASGEVRARISLSDAIYQPPDGLKLQRFGAVQRKQRCGLLLQPDATGRKALFLGTGSFNEDADTNQGWVIAYDLPGGMPVFATAWTSSSRYSGGGIWMSGMGLAADAGGRILGMTGNGAFDGRTEFGECCFALTYQAAVGGRPASLFCASYFAGFTDTGMVDGNPTLADTSLIPGYDAGTDAPGNAANMNGANDTDFGSGAPLSITRAMSGLSRDVVLGAGKHGILYVMDGTELGSPFLQDFAPDAIEAGVYGKLLSPPIWWTYYNAEASAAPQHVSALPTTYEGRTHHQHASMVFRLSPVHGPLVYTWGENSNLRVFRLNADFTLTYLACSAEVASVDCGPPGGMPGGHLCLSSDGQEAGTALVFATVSYGDANREITQGRLLVYDADGLTTFSDGSGCIPVLWDSQEWEAEFLFNKFNAPIAANGLVFVPTYGATVDIYGLTGSAP